LFTIILDLLYYHRLVHDVKLVNFFSFHFDRKVFLLNKSQGMKFITYFFKWLDKFNGESRKRKIDIRAITATQQDLYSRVRAGHFREDLYYRLKVFPVQLPPLRERKEDIPLPVSHFINLMNKKTATPFPKSALRKKLSKEVLLDLLDACDRNKAEVGRRVGRSHTSIWKYMKKWEIPLKKPS